MEQIPQTQLEPEVRTGEGLSVRRFFTAPGEHPFDSVEWELRDARIGQGDKVSFEQQDVEFPKSWSQKKTLGLALAPIALVVNRALARVHSRVAQRNLV